MCKFVEIAENKISAWKIGDDDATKLFGFNLLQICQYHHFYGSTNSKSLCEITES
jgi:hypothetical protein